MKLCFFSVLGCRHHTGTQLLFDFDEKQVISFNSKAPISPLCRCNCTKSRITKKAPINKYWFFFFLCCHSCYFLFLTFKIKHFSLSLHLVKNHRSQFISANLIYLFSGTNEHWEVVHTIRCFLVLWRRKSWGVSWGGSWSWKNKRRAAVFRSVLPKSQQLSLAAPILTCCIMWTLVSIHDHIVAFLDKSKQILIIDGDDQALFRFSLNVSSFKRALSSVFVDTDCNAWWGIKLSIKILLIRVSFA